MYGIAWWWLNNVVVKKMANYAYCPIGRFITSNPNTCTVTPTVFRTAKRQDAGTVEKMDNVLLNLVGKSCLQADDSQQGFAARYSGGHNGSVPVRASVQRASLEYKRTGAACKTRGFQVRLRRPEDVDTWHGIRGIDTVRNQLARNAPATTILPAAYNEFK